MPTQNIFAQNSAAKDCCADMGNCNMPKKDQKKEGSKDCCNTTVAVFQFVKLSNSSELTVTQNHDFPRKKTFHYSPQILLNTLSEGVWQPPRFI